jgi:hypothetical protein
VPACMAERDQHCADGDHAGVLAVVIRLIAPAAMRQATINTGMVLPPPPPPQKRPTKAERRRQTNKAMQELLRQRWPDLFTFARPLAIGIHRDIGAARPPISRRSPAENRAAGWMEASRGYVQPRQASSARRDRDRTLKT